MAARWQSICIFPYTYGHQRLDMGFQIQVSLKCVLSCEQSCCVPCDLSSSSCLYFCSFNACSPFTYHSSLANKDLNPHLNNKFQSTRMMIHCWPWRAHLRPSSKQTVGFSLTAWFLSIFLLFGNLFLIAVLLIPSIMASYLSGFLTSQSPFFVVNLLISWSGILNQAVFDILANEDAKAPHTIIGTDCVSLGSPDSVVPFSDVELQHNMDTSFFNFCNKLSNYFFKFFGQGLKIGANEMRGKNSQRHI